MPSFLYFFFITEKYALDYNAKNYIGECVCENVCRAVFYRSIRLSVCLMHALTEMQTLTPYISAVTQKDFKTKLFFKKNLKKFVFKSVFFLPYNTKLHLNLSPMSVIGEYPRCYIV